MLSGDARHSQVGHSAMQCTYSVQDCSTGRIVHVEQAYASKTIAIIFITIKLHFSIDTSLMFLEDGDQSQQCGDGAGWPAAADGVLC